MKSGFCRVRLTDVRNRIALKTPHPNSTSADGSGTAVGNWRIVKLVYPFCGRMSSGVSIEKLNVADPPAGTVPPDQLSCTNVAASVEKTGDVGDGSRVGASKSGNRISGITNPPPGKKLAPAPLPI